MFFVFLMVFLAGYAQANQEPYMLKDIYPGSGSSETLYPFTEYDGKLYFSADNGSNGDELWVLSNDNIPGDVTMFLEDFGRSQFNNPCPACVAGDWCVY